MKNFNSLPFNNKGLTSTYKFKYNSIFSGIEAQNELFFEKKNSSILQKNIAPKINEFLYSTIEQVLIKKIEEDKNSKLDAELKNFSYFSKYQNALLKSNWHIIANEYPVAKELFLQQQDKAVQLISSITQSFYSDRIDLFNNQMLTSLDNNIEDIEWGLGDLHNGLSTSILKLSKDKTIVFKPNDGKITKAYHHFLDWINQYQILGNYKYKSLNRKGYHWLEFVNYESCQAREDISEYYRRAGSILCIVYLLNGQDFHYENLISRGRNPVLIDHETIIQPQLSKDYHASDYRFNTEFKDSVLESFLLPYKEMAKNYTKGMCGFGCHNETQILGLKKTSINKFSDEWKIVARIVKQEFSKENIPSYKGKKIYLNNYIKEFLSGFELCYNLFLREKKYLLSKNSPVKAFENLPVRYIWRPTNVYLKILEYMSLPKNLTNKGLYEQKIRDYLSIAYKKMKESKKVNLILESEVSQMLRGDVPYFGIDTSSRNLITEHGIIEDFFEFSCTENLERKLKKLSQKDLEFQKNLILKNIFD